MFALIGSTIKNNRKEILESALPANLQALIKQVIPPKSIRRKAIEGAELLDYGDDETYLFDDDDDDDDGIDCVRVVAMTRIMMQKKFKMSQQLSQQLLNLQEQSHPCLIYVQIVPSIRTQSF